MAENMDDLYESLFGSRPKKRGTGYELIVAATLKHLNKDATVTHNAFIKSSFSDDKHQSDTLMKMDAEAVFVEAKDHLEGEAKVGRPEIAKLAGSLLVLTDIDRGILASATGFTQPAAQFSEDLRQAKAKPVDLYVIRPIENGDDIGRVKTIIFNLHILIPNYNSAQYTPFLKPEAQTIIKNLNLPEGTKVDVKLEAFYRCDGSQIVSISELTANLSCDENIMAAQGTWKFDEEAFIYFGDRLIPIERFEYNIPYISEDKELRINAGEPAIFVNSLDGSVNKLITIEALKKAHDEVLRERKT